MLEKIVITGARQHNLKNLDIEIPHGRFTVISGVSGSGKSSLAFDTLYAEGQRRYIESLSTYTKQFLERLAHPDVDDVAGISPSIAIQQKNTTRSARSTIGTATEIYDYLRLLYARVGRTFCPDCNIEVVRYAPDEVIDDLLEAFRGETVYITAPIRVENGDPEEIAARLLSEGYSRVLVRKSVVSIDPPPKRKIAENGTVNLILDRITIDGGKRARILEAVENAYGKTEGRVRCVAADFSAERTYTNRLRCASCGRTFEEPKPLLFSFNTPFGACPHCRGFGNRMEFDERLIVPDPNRSIRDHAIEPWSSERMERLHAKLLSFCRKRRISIDKPFSSLSEKQRSLILEGEGAFTGVIPFLENLREKTYKRYARFYTRKYLSFKRCRYCRGGRLRPEAFYIKLDERTIRDVSAMTPGDALAFVKGLVLSGRERVIARDILMELESRLQFLLDVGLYYVTLDRLTRTLSGGEAQRINLANSLGASLVGILYVLDEPSIGLHPRDTEKLVRVLMTLRDRGNTVVVVEHDLDIIRRADHLIDLGPGAGEAGGELLYQGPLEKMRSSRSRTIRYLKRGLPLPRTAKRRFKPAGWLELQRVSEHNLKEIDVSVPLGAFVAVTGVSGSGKSTLVCDVLYESLRVDAPGYRRAYSDMSGTEAIKRVLMVDQSPVGKTTRSNPVTYIKAFSYIRDIFASRKTAVKRGYRSGRFSFNVPGGRCNRCQGLGYERIEMHFMADLYVPCSDCDGKRFNQETLEITFKGKNLAQVLDMTIDEAIEFFGEYRPLVSSLGVLQKVGLGYLRLGQPSTTLSGGESQRMKIARELADGGDGGGFYILDEPTTGLHIEDVTVLVAVLRELVERGNTVVVIEHNPQLILQTDYVIDLGPGGGEDGGRVVACGTPAQIMKSRSSHTGAYLRALTGKRKRTAS